MNCENNQKEITIGVDTGKFQLDIHIRPLDIYFTVDNNEKGIKEALKKIKPHKPTRIVIEATGRKGPHMEEENRREAVQTKLNNKTYEVKSNEFFMGE